MQYAAYTYLYHVATLLLKLMKFKNLHTYFQLTLSWYDALIEVLIVLLGDFNIFMRV